MPQLAGAVVGNTAYAQYVNPQWVRLLDLLDMHVQYTCCEGAEFCTSDGRRVLDFLTPKHGSWLNIAAMAWSAFTGQCLERRMPDIETLRNETRAWEKRRHERHKGVDWQFTTQNARIKLKRLYPQIQA